MNGGGHGTACDDSAADDCDVVSCDDCNGQGGYFAAPDSTDPAEAIAAWNRRAPSLGGSPSGGTVTLNNDPITVTVGDPVGYRRAPAKEKG